MRSLIAALLVLVCLKCVLTARLFANYNIAATITSQGLLLQQQQQQRDGNNAVISASDGEDTMFEKIKVGLTHNIALVRRGMVDLVGNFKKAEKLKKLRKNKGDVALSYSEYRFLEKSKEDWSKSFRLMLTIPFSPEFFFYSYIVFPMMSKDNPWAWKAMPSSFDDPSDKVRRHNALRKRRMQAVVVALQTMQNDLQDDLPTEKRTKRAEEMQIINDALKAKSLEASMDILAPWLVTSRAAQKKQKRGAPQQLTLSQVPGNIVKEVCKAFGIDGVPNLPLLNRMNRGEVSRQLEAIKASDDFLLMKGTKSLSASEIEAACYERCISTSGNKAPEKDLDQWLSIVTTPSTAPPSALSGGLRGKTNYQNKRFALMALNVAKDIRTAEYAAVYRSLVSN